MTLTRQFQLEVAQKITTLFDVYIESVRTSERWTQLNDRFRDLHEYEPDDSCDADNLFAIEKMLETEIHLIQAQERRICNNRNLPEICKVLECIAEAETNYFENDAAISDNDELGRAIYSPKLDLTIAPSIEKPRNRTHKSIGAYKLSNGPLIFKKLSELSLIKRIAGDFKRAAQHNYSNSNINYSKNNNARPLCLFAIEIEKQTNLKYMMGDFINSLMLSKYPIVLVPDNNLNRCLDLLKLANIIDRVKGVPVYNLFSRVMVLSVSQFRSVINTHLIENNIEPLGVTNFS